MGAIIRSWRSAPRKVVVVQGARGILSTRRWPRGHRHKRRVMLPLVQVSSMNTNRRRRRRPSSPPMRCACGMSRPRTAWYSPSWMVMVGLFPSCGRYQAMENGVPDKSGDIMYSKPVHKCRSVRIDRFKTCAQCAGNNLGGMTFGYKLQYLTLTWS
jgi:hypothetical protein